MRSEECDPGLEDDWRLERPDRGERGEAGPDSRPGMGISSRGRLDISSILSCESNSRSIMSDRQHYLFTSDLNIFRRLSLI